jgi:hypothetical protein
MTPKQYADIEAGNMLAKNLVYPAKADSAGIVLGARFRSSLHRARIPCAAASHPAPQRSFTPMRAGTGQP